MYSLNIIVLGITAVVMLGTVSCYKLINKRLFSPLTEKVILTFLIIGILVTKLYFNIVEYLGNYDNIILISSVLNNTPIASWSNDHWVGAFIYSKLTSGAFMIDLPSIFLLVLWGMICFTKVGKPAKIIAPFAFFIGLFSIMNKFGGGLYADWSHDPILNGLDAIQNFKQPWWEYIFYVDKVNVDITLLTNSSAFQVQQISGQTSHYIITDYFRFPIAIMLMVISFIIFFRSDQYNRWSFLGIISVNFLVLLGVYVAGKFLKLNFFTGGFSFADWRLPEFNDGKHFYNSVFSPFAFFGIILGIGESNWIIGPACMFFFTFLLSFEIALFKNLMTVNASKLSTIMNPWYFENWILRVPLSTVDALINNVLYRYVPHGLFTFAFVRDKRLQRLKELKRDIKNNVVQGYDLLKVEQDIQLLTQKVDKSKPFLRQNFVIK